MATAELKETSKEKLKALQLTIDKLEKSYGKGTIMKMGDQAIELIESISTGSILGRRICLFDFLRKFVRKIRFR